MSKNPNPKDVLQAEVGELLQKHGSGIVALSTGSGKSATVIKHIKKNYTRNNSIMWVVPTEQLRDVDIPNEFRKWDAEEFVDSVRFICYASLFKIKRSKWDLIVLDEAHRVTTLNSKFFKSNLFDDVICLTATLPHEEEKKQILYGDLGLDVIKRMGIDEARDRNIVPDFKIVAVTLDPDPNKEVMWNSKRPNNTTNEVNMINYYNQKLSSASTKDFKRIALTRYRQFACLPTRVAAAKRIIQGLQAKDRRSLVFSTYKSVALQLDPTQEFSFYQGTGSAALEDFNDKASNLLITCQKLDEGVNLADANRAVVMMLNSSDRRFIQRMGRVLRNHEGEKSIIYVLLMRGTSDHKNWAKIERKYDLEVEHKVLRV